VTLPIQGHEVMTIKDLSIMYDYDDWANNRVFEVLSSIPPEEFTRLLGGSYGSIRNTMVHVVSAQAGWLDRCGGPQRGPRLNPEDFPTVVSLRGTYEGVRAQVGELFSII
jgi:uncharacterized damage-inducible protein DinB